MTQPKRGLFDYLSDPGELSFLRVAMNGALSDRMRLAYAARLDETDPERAEWLRLEVDLHARASEDPAKRARFAELSRLTSHDWRKLLRRDMMLNCGSAKEEPPRVRFAFACPERWETLLPTEQDAVRFCGRCKERVYFCESGRDASEHARAGHCIAVPADLADREVNLNTRNMVGRPNPVGDWADRLFPEDR